MSLWTLRLPQFSNFLKTFRDTTGVQCDSCDLAEVLVGTDIPDTAIQVLQYAIRVKTGHLDLIRKCWHFAVE